MKCVFCGHQLTKDTQTIERRLKSHLVYINNVPVDLCKSCGEVYVDDYIVSEINQFLQTLKRQEILNTVEVDFKTFKEQSAANFSESSQRDRQKLITA